MPYAGPEPVVISDVDVEPVPVVTSDTQAPPPASRVAVPDSGLVRKESASVSLVLQAFPSGSGSLPSSSPEEALCLVTSPVPVEDAVSSSVRLPVFFQTELLAAKIDLVRHGRPDPEDVPALVASLPAFSCKSLCRRQWRALRNLKIWPSRLKM